MKTSPILSSLSLLSILLISPAASASTIPTTSIAAKPICATKISSSLSLAGVNQHITSLLNPKMMRRAHDIDRCIPYIIADELIRYTGLPAATLVESSPAASPAEARKKSLESDSFNSSRPFNLNNELQRIIAHQKNGIIQDKVKNAATYSSSVAISPINAHALLVLQLAQDKGKLPAEAAVALELGYNKIKEAFQRPQNTSKFSMYPEEKQGNKAKESRMTKIEYLIATDPMGLYSLARANKLSPAEFDLFIAEQKKNKLQAERYESDRYSQLIAHVARLIEHPQAAALQQAALEKRKPYNAEGWINYPQMPRLSVLQMLEHIERAPQDPELLPKLLIVLDESKDKAYHTEWQYDLAWNYLLLERYFQTLKNRPQPLYY